MWHEWYEKNSNREKMEQTKLTFNTSFMKSAKSVLTFCTTVKVHLMKNKNKHVYRFRKRRLEQIS